MKNSVHRFKASETTLYFNSRDELVRIPLERVAYIESDTNYCNFVCLNGAKATILSSMQNIATLIATHFQEESPMFVRIGKRHIINIRYLFRINIPRQKLYLTDCRQSNIIELPVAKEALKNLKQLYNPQP